MRDDPVGVFQGFVNALSKCPFYCLDSRLLGNDRFTGFGAARPGWGQVPDQVESRCYCASEAE